MKVIKEWAPWIVLLAVVGYLSGLILGAGTSRTSSGIWPLVIACVVVAVGCFSRYRHIKELEKRIDTVDGGPVWHISEDDQKSGWHFGRPCPSGRMLRPPLTVDEIKDCDLAAFELHALRDAAILGQWISMTITAALRAACTFLIWAPALALWICAFAWFHDPLAFADSLSAMGDVTQAEVSYLASLVLAATLMFILIVVTVGPAIGFRSGVPNLWEEAKLSMLQQYVKTPTTKPLRVHAALMFYSPLEHDEQAHHTLGTHRTS